MASLARQVIRAGRELAIKVPIDTPCCCRRHAVNHIRHQGTAYDEILGARRLAKGFSQADAGYTQMREGLDARIENQLMSEGRLPSVDDCRPPHRPPQAINGVLVSR